jgi:hypothetical protein
MISVSSKRVVLRGFFVPGFTGYARKKPHSNSDVRRFLEECEHKLLVVEFSAVFAD